MAGTAMLGASGSHAAYITPTTVSAGYLVEQTGQNLYRRLHAMALPLIKDQKDKEGHKHVQCFLATELVSWLVKEGDFSNRHDAVAFLHALLQTGVLEAVAGNSSTFSDSHQLYRFRADNPALATSTTPPGSSRRKRRNSRRGGGKLDDSEESLAVDSGALGSSSSMEAALTTKSSPVLRRARDSWTGEFLGFPDELEAEEEESVWGFAGVSASAAAGSSVQGLFEDGELLRALQEQDAVAFRQRLISLQLITGASSPVNSPPPSAPSSRTASFSGGVTKPNLRGPPASAGPVAKTPAPFAVVNRRASTSPASAAKGPSAPTSSSTSTQEQPAAAATAAAADVNKSRDLTLLVLFAMQHNAPNCATVAVNAGADLNVSLNNTGDTVLHRAALLNDRRAVSFLVERGAHVNAVNSVGSTPLLLASTREENHECAVLLLEQGARIRAVNNDGKRPIDYMPALAETQRLLCTSIGNNIVQMQDPLAALQALNKLACNPETHGMLSEQLQRPDVLLRLQTLCSNSLPASKQLASYIEDLQRNEAMVLDPDSVACLLALTAVPGLVRQRALEALVGFVGRSAETDDDYLPQLSKLKLQPIMDALVAAAQDAEELLPHLSVLDDAATLLSFVTRFPRPRAALATEFNMRSLIQRLLQLSQLPETRQPSRRAPTCLLSNVVRLLGNLSCELQHERQFRSVGTVSAMRALLHDPDLVVRQQAARTLIILGEQEVGGVDLFTPSSEEFLNLDSPAEVLYHRRPAATATATPAASRSGPSSVMASAASSVGSPATTSRASSATGSPSVTRSSRAGTLVAGEASAVTNSGEAHPSGARNTSPATVGGLAEGGGSSAGAGAAWQRLKGASLERTIQLLTEPVDNNTTHCAMAFVMYQPYWPAKVAFRLLRHRFRNTAMHAEVETLPPEHLVIVRLLRQWIDQALTDFTGDSAMMKELKVFLEQMQATGGPYAVAAGDLLQQQIKAPDGSSDGSQALPNSGVLSYKEMPHEKLYMAAKQAVLSGEVPLSTEMAVALAAAQVRIDDLARRASNYHAAQAVMRTGMPPVKLRNVLPVNFARGRDSKALLAAMQAEYEKLAERSDRDCKHLYLGIYHLVANHDCKYFAVKQLLPDGKKKVQRLVGISPMRLLLVDDKTKKLLSSHSLTQLKTWQKVQLVERPAKEHKLSKSARKASKAAATAGAGAATSAEGNSGSGPDSPHGRSVELVLQFMSEEIVVAADNSTLDALSDTILQRIRNHPRYLAKVEAGNRVQQGDALASQGEDEEEDEEAEDERAEQQAAGDTADKGQAGAAAEGVGGSEEGKRSAVAAAAAAAERASRSGVAGRPPSRETGDVSSRRPVPVASGRDWSALITDDGHIDLDGDFFRAAGVSSRGGSNLNITSSGPGSVGGRGGSEAETPGPSAQATPVIGTPQSSTLASPRASPPASPAQFRKRSVSLSVDGGAAPGHKGAAASNVGAAGALTAAHANASHLAVPAQVSAVAAPATVEGPRRRTTSTAASLSGSIHVAVAGSSAAAGSAIPASPSSTANTNSSSASSATTSKRRQSRKGSRRLVVCDCPPNPALRAGLDLRTLTATQLLQHPLELARQLTLLDHSFFKAITREECLNKVFTSGKQQNNGRTGEAGKSLNGVSRFIERFNLLSAWVARLVVEEPELQRRIWTLQQLLRTALHCRQQNNFNSAVAITSALSTAAIRRLTETWDALHPEARQVYEKLLQLIQADNNFKVYRDALEAAGTPAVPYFGMNLRDLTFLHHGNPDYVKYGLVNIYKLRSLGAQLVKIQELQRGRYNILVVPEIRDFLLKIEGSDDDTLYRLSQQVQPPTTSTRRTNSGTTRSSGSGGGSASGAGPLSAAVEKGSLNSNSSEGRTQGLTRRSSSTNLSFARMGAVQEFFFPNKGAAGPR